MGMDMERLSSRELYTTIAYFRTCDAKHIFCRIQIIKMQSQTLIERPK